MFLQCWKQGIPWYICVKLLSTPNSASNSGAYFLSLLKMLNVQQLYDLEYLNNVEEKKNMVPPPNCPLGDKQGNWDYCICIYLLCINESAIPFHLYLVW